MSAIPRPQTHQPQRGWTVVIPVKRLGEAKTRLQREQDPQRSELAAAFAQDAVSAALACEAVERVIAVCDDVVMRGLLSALGAECVSEDGHRGLNAAMSRGAAAARAQGLCPVAMMAGDLPALSETDLAAFLLQASPEPRAFAADRSGEGTCILTITDGADPDPRFGADSAQAHRDSGATDLSAVAGPTLRCDVDTDADLQLAVALGVGAFTDAALKA